MIRPAEFSEYGWQRFLPFVAKQEPGGITLVAIEVSDVRNFPRVTVATFDADARRRLKRALKAEARRTKP